MRRKILRRRGQIEQAIRADVSLLGDSVEFRFQAGVMRCVVEAQRMVADLLGELVEPRIGFVDAAEVDNAFAHVRGKLVAKRPARHAYNGKILRQQAALLKVKKRWQQLALGQIAGGAEDDHDDRIRECARRTWEPARDPQDEPSSAQLRLPWFHYLLLLH